MNIFRNGIKEMMCRHISPFVVKIRLNHLNDHISCSTVTTNHHLYKHNSVPKYFPTVTSIIIEIE